MNKYNDLCADIFKNESFQKKEEYVNEVKEDLPPEAGELRISTSTMISSFNTNINLYLVDKYFIRDDVITFMDNGGKPIKNSAIKTKNNRPFFNQATLLVKLNPLKKINVKIFSNGKIQMTGVKRKIDGMEALEYILNKIKNTEGKIPLSKLFPRELLIRLQKKKNFKGYLPDEFISDKKKIFNDKKLNIDKELKNVPLSLFFMDEDYCLKYLNIDNIVKELLKDFNGEDVMVHSHSIEDLEKVKITEISIVNIVSDFNINFKVKREILYNIIRNKYQIISRFDPCIYPGVKNKFYFNKEYLDREHPGKCYCKGKCLGKGDGNGEGDCKKITISIFQSGSILITGAKNVENIEYIRKFIIQVIKDNYNLIRKVKTPFEDMEEIVEQEPKKYIRTSDIVYIKRESLNNEFNKHIYQKYLDFIKNK
jgi:TATA-box binding protein (TBP) (component of TFIID and TFIIIB)